MHDRHPTRQGGRVSDILVGRRILVVEDEMLVLMTIETVLEGFGCSAISAAASVADGLALLAEHTFDAALLDINLGGEKSYPVADALARRGIPFAFSTGYRDHGDRLDFTDRPVLRKPYTISDLETVLKQLLAEGSLPMVARHSPELISTSLKY